MRPAVVKVGGGLLGSPGALDLVCEAVAGLGRREPVVVVPGGGPLADAVRELDREVGLSPDAAHWMALLAMDQYAHLLVERIPGGRLVEEPGAIAAVLAAGEVAVLAPSRWLRAADALPHGWDVTSDSVAAYVAGALDAVRLDLVKPAEVGAQGVDPCFATVLPAGLEVRIVGWERFVAAVPPVSRGWKRGGSG
jgi:5-(aminomethyl)-3-furanmethanol phosphate kinase